MNFKELIKTKDYDFLRTNENLKNIILLTLGGSYAYGTNNENSDVDIRGIALNTKEELLGIYSPFECFTDVNTDTVVYGFNKVIKLLMNCNPNTIEMLGCKPEHYLVLTKAGKLLKDNYKLFLSKKAIYSFGGYANDQLRCLENKTNINISQSEKEEYILKAIKNASTTFKDRYLDAGDSIKLYIDKKESKAENRTEDKANNALDTEIFMDVNLCHYPLRDYKCMWSEMNSIVKEYSKVGNRNQSAMDHNKLAKHMMHLFRLYLMCIDILEEQEINTYRKEYELLMDIRNGQFIKDNKPTIDFYDLLNEYEAKMQYAIMHTTLPEKPDYKKINELVVTINKTAIKG